MKLADRNSSPRIKRSEKKIAARSRSRIPDPVVRLVGAEQCPIVEALVPSTLWENRIGNLLIARRQPNFRQRFTTHILDGKPVPAGTPGAKKCVTTIEKWYVDFRDTNGITQRVPGFTDRKAMVQRAAELERRAAWQMAGLIAPNEDHRKRPLLQHLDDFRRELESKGNTPGGTSERPFPRL